MLGDRFALAVGVGREDQLVGVLAAISDRRFCALGSTSQIMWKPAATRTMPSESPEIAGCGGRSRAPAAPSRGASRTAQFRAAPPAQDRRADRCGRCRQRAPRLCRSRGWRDGRPHRFRARAPTRSQPPAPMSRASRSAKRIAEAIVTLNCWRHSRAQNCQMGVTAIRTLRPARATFTSGLVK
jgi:hypothetical protein